MELTIMKPGQNEPSHIPRTKRAAKRPAKFLQAAWQHTVTPQMNMFKLESSRCTISLQKIELDESACNQPHPFSDGEPLQRQILRELEREISKKVCRGQPDPSEY